MPLAFDTLTDEQFCNMNDAEFDAMVDFFIPTDFFIAAMGSFIPSGRTSVYQLNTKIGIYRPTNQKDQIRYE